MKKYILPPSFVVVVLVFLWPGIPRCDFGAKVTTLAATDITATSAILRERSIRAACARISISSRATDHVRDVFSPDATNGLMELRFKSVSQAMTG